MSKKFLCLFIAFALLIGCTSMAMAEVNVVAGSIAEIGDMNPYYVTGCKTTWQNAIYEGLGQRAGVGGPLTLQLAKSYEQVDNVTYDIEIYDYIYDSEGNHITADDIVFCYQWMKESGTVSKMGNLASIEATGEYSVRMVLTKETVGVFEDMMTRNIVSKAEYEKNNGNMALVNVGTGPYKLDELVAGSSITLSKRDNYWQTDEAAISDVQKANVDTLTIKYISSSSQLAIALQNHEIDGILYMMGADTDYFVNADDTAREGYFVFPYQDPNTYHLFCNMDSHSILADNHALREAIFRSIVPEDIIDGVLAGKASTTHDYANNLYPDYNPKWDEEDYFDYDPDKVAALLKEAGYNGEELKLVTYNMSPYKEAVELLQAYWEMVGIKVSLSFIEQTQRDTMFADVANWDLFMLQTLSADYIVNCYTYLLDANNWGGATITHYEDQTFQDLLHTAAAVDTYSQESVDAFHYYMMDTAIARGIAAINWYSIWNDGMEAVYRQRNGYVMPTACTYSDSWSSVADK